MEKFNSILKYSKGEVLLKLTDLNHIYKVPKTKLIKVKEWKKSKNITYLNLKKIFKSKVAVRSSAKDEDGKYESKAGRYESFLNVDINNKKIFFRNVDKVIESYSKSKSTNHDNQIIIQEMVKNIKSSGVVFTKDIENGTDYYVINYDDVTGKTNTVTSGSGSHANRILYIYKKSKDEIKSARFKKIIKFVQFLENYLKSDKIDIEFAINNNLDIYLFQVRLISTSKKWKKNYRSEIDKRINNEEKQIKKLFFSKKKILGSSTIFGIMPDWNPVEIIGKHPSLLSISLYKYLITDNTWSKARSRMGYRNLKKNKLMRIICGQPYIDTRLSLNSFLPSKLSTKIGKKIVDKGIFLLKKYPFFHDKIEFKISEPSFNFNSKKKVKELFQDVLTIKEQKIFVSELKNLTKKLIEEKGKFSIKYSISKILFLDKEFEKVKLNKTLANVNYLLKKCKSIGTLNFSILARHAFIAKSFLNSLVENKTLSLKDLSNFEQSLNSITTKMLEDSNLVFKKKKSINYFMKKYGHLRPGTYDLTSKRYDQMKNFKFNPTFKKSKNFN
ncbi:PEP/pyruvate-binding domain-containing protein, partial [Candidatus Pelagibacter sp.]|nr:PEP/pyruvate-binding domain-containing protein [Candidatus Pelagibacter sp.]